MSHALGRPLQPTKPAACVFFSVMYTHTYKLASKAPPACASTTCFVRGASAFHKLVNAACAYSFFFLAL